MCVGPSDDGLSEGRRLRRFALISNGLGLIAAYALVVPLKLNGLTPANFTWLDGLIVLPLFFPTLASILILSTLFPRHETLCILVPSAIFLGVGLTIMTIERGL